jgi:signal transduction histidine kinase
VVAELRDANPGRIVQDRFTLTGRIHCDRARVQQLLSNLLGNALAHGAPDQPVVIEGSIDGDSLLFTVSNRGNPIAPADLHKVFEPYWRSSRSTPAEGLGLGLYICSQIVRGHGGSLQVSSSAEAGTCFSARLPISTAQD